MVVINICGLNRNTKIELIIKEQQEILDIKSTADSDEENENGDKLKDNEKDIEQDSF